MKEVIAVVRDLFGVAMLIALGYGLFVLLPIILELTK